MKNERREEIKKKGNEIQNNKKEKETIQNKMEKKNEMRYKRKQNKRGGNHATYEKR